VGAGNDKQRFLFPKGIHTVIRTPWRLPEQIRYAQGLARIAECFIHVSASMSRRIHKRNSFSSQIGKRFYFLITAVAALADEFDLYPYGWQMYCQRFYLWKKKQT